MSSVIVTTITPFIDKDILCKALSNIGVKYTVKKIKLKLIVQIFLEINILNT